MTAHKPDLTVLLVSTWDTACGIAEHAALLKQHVEAADRGIVLDPYPAGLDPSEVFEYLYAKEAVHEADVVHLNYHAALHSRWTPKEIQRLQEDTPVLVTYHDTGVPNSEQCRAVCAAADYFVVHEPYDDLPAHGEYLRQGIPDPEEPVIFDLLAAQMRREGRWWRGQPVVGTVGFPFPWKNYDLLVEAAALAAWGVLLLAPNATPEQVGRWMALHPACAVETSFRPRREVVSALSGCDATAFLYTCANTGTSGAIRQGIAARKPVLAFSDRVCRQFRDLGTDPLGQRAVTWLEDGRPEAVADQLSALPSGRLDFDVVRLAEQDSWCRVGTRYAEIFRMLQNRTQPEGR